TTEVLTALGLDKKTIAVQKLRDIFKNASIKYTGKSYVVLIGVENQSDIHYSIPVKNMFYDVMAYGNQVKETAKKHRREKDTATSDEFLSGFTKEDKLIPVITITVYLGTKEWDGPRRLSDMFGDVDEELLPFIPDYRINLLAPREITDFTGFRTSIRQLFEVLQNAYDKEKMQEVLQNDEKFSKVDRETVEAINLFAGTDIDIDEKEEVIDMCKAWEEQKNEGRELGREEGRELGERQKIISQIVKKLQKDKSVAEIADDLEEKEEVIAPIYEAALSMKPDYDVEKIYELLEKNKKLA
ncbi:Rpn family recombination-promoting nuclease/putative transposase, partial [Agathobacter rectalis]